MSLTSFAYSYYSWSINCLPKIPAFLDILQYLWLFTHAVTLFGTFVCFGEIGETGITLGLVPFVLVYEIVVSSAVVTYSIVTYRRYCLLVGNQLETNADRADENLVATSIPLSEVLKTENAHLLAFALLWLSTSPNIIKILPFTVYSFLNLGNYMLDEVFPKYQFSIAMKPLMEYLENPLLIAAAHLDGLIFFILSKESYLSGSGYAIVLYSLVWGLRIECSEASRCSLYTLLTVIDYFVYQDYNPMWLKNVWSKTNRTITLLIPLTKFDKEETTSMYNYIDQFLPSSSNSRKVSKVGK